MLSGASGLLLSVLDRPGASVGATGTDQTGVATGVPGTVSIVNAPVATAPVVTAPAVTAPPVTAPPITTPGETAPPVVATTPLTTPATTPVTVASTVPAAPVCSTVDGPTVQTRWGPVQVEASVTPSGQICAVDAIQSPGGRGRSISINSYAVPILDQDALTAQGATFNGVSGATITSRGYKQSLQALLDGLG